MKRWVGAGVLLAAIAMGAIFAWTPKVPPSVPRGEFGGVPLRLEYALTPAERERGLSGRESVPEGYGMLFVFPTDDRYGFWMNDTLVPLDMYWLDSKGHVVSMALSVATSSYPNVFYPAEPARYVLETMAGFGVAHQIATGTPLLLQSFPSVSH